MNDNIVELIKIFNDNLDKWISAKQLAEFLGISTRSVRRYISQINIEREYILSSSKGYKSIEVINEFFKNNDNTPEQRRQVIISKLLLSNSGLDIYELADELHVSESTIINDIHNIRNDYDKYDVDITINKQFVFFEGDESYKRYFMRNLFYEESNEDFFNLKIISDTFGNKYSEKIKSLIINELKDHNIFINEYLVNTILIHISVSLYRIQEDNILESEGDVFKDTVEYQIATNIFSEIERMTEVSIPISEIYNLSLIITSKTSHITFENIQNETYKNFIDKYYVDFTLDIIKKIEKTYHVNLNNEDFVIRFSIHLKNLIDRVEKGVKLQNPLAFEVKSSYPLIYNLSVFIAYEIQKEIGQVIDEQEIGYISFHVGSYFEREKYMRNKIDCAVIVPQYHNMSDQIIDRLNKEFSDVIEIVKVINHITHDLSNLKESLIISSIPIPNNPNTIKVTPFLNTDDISRIRERIDHLYSDMKLRRFIDYFDIFFTSELFVIEEGDITKEESINILAERMIEKEYIDQSYVQSVFERESLSSTAFTDYVAMPHAITQNAFKSGFGVLISTKGIPWDSNHISKIIVLTSMSKKDRFSFLPVFDSTIERLSDMEISSKILEARDFESFRKVLTSSR